jgi:dTDP-glucose pyrophosphorylase
MGKPLASTSKTHIIVPCAGYGVRVGSPPAKELLPHPTTKKPLIEGCLEMAEETGWPLVLITRPEKKVLIDYVHQQEKQRHIHVEWVLVKNTKEWPESVLASQPFWGEQNLLLLPDVEWNPKSAVVEIVDNLKTYDISYGLFESENLQTWGTVEISDRQIRVCEKPRENYDGFLPWGLLAFKRSVGRFLFDSLLRSTLDHEVRTLPFKAQKIALDSFVDLTRGQSPL